MPCVEASSDELTFGPWQMQSLRDIIDKSGFFEDTNTPVSFPDPSFTLTEAMKVECRS